MNVLKKVVILNLCALNSLIGISQTSGKIISERLKPVAGTTVIYTYVPPKHLAIPQKIYASIVYGKGEKHHFKKIPVQNIKGKYQFSFRPSDSADALIISITDEKNNPVDNNDEIGFIVLLHNKNGTEIPSSSITAMYLLSYYALDPLSLNYGKLRPVMIKLFENGYKSYRTTENEKPYYTFYLTLLYQEKKEAVKPMLLAYAEKQASVINSEPAWMNAIKIYRLLGMDQNCQALEQKAVSIYPNGTVAKEKYINDFEQKEGSEQSILEAMNEYIRRFNDTSMQMNYTFYTDMIENLLYHHKYDRLAIYEPLTHNKAAIAKIYNRYALELSGNDQLDNKGSDINFARFLAKKDLDYFAAARSAAGDSEDDGSLQRIYNKYAATYALILYKLEQFDSAFYYQDALYKEGSLDIHGLERYITYAEKAKGPRYAYKLVVHQLLNGISSPVITQELKLLAEKSGIPDSSYDSLRVESAKLSAKLANEKIRKFFGTAKSKEIRLKNLDGQSISLAGLRNKVVVLDFWATWCGPCRSSFPVLKQTIDLYKSDSDVVFLFIDTWERSSPAMMKENAIKVMKTGNYDFQVLLDERNKAADVYKVDEIPACFIIDKKGNIVFMGESSNLALEIENARRAGL